MNKMKKIILLISLLIMGAGLVGCNNDTTTTEASTEAKTTTEAVAEEAGYPVSITDSMGIEVTIEAEPMKVVSVAPSITELMFELGLEEKLIGRTDYCDYPEGVSQIESIGNLMEPDIEKIVSLDPDVVIASTHFSEENEKKLTDLGIKVVVLYEETDMDGVYSIIETMGKIFNVNDVATSLVDDMKTVITDTKTSIKGLEAPTVYYVVGYGEYGDYTAGGDTFISKLITEAGGVNIAQDISGWSYSIESLLEADPDIIIIDNSMKEDFMSSENYKELSAVKNNQVYGIDKNLVERQGYRNAEGIKVLATIFHPEAFK